MPNIPLETIVTIVAPLITVALTLVLWAILVVVQSPRPYWRDSFNRAIAGLLASLAVLLVVLALVAAGVAEVGVWEARAVIGVPGVFALLGLPRTIDELRDALSRPHERT